MGSENFYSFLSRMKYINRWGVMRNTRYETLQEHSMETAVIAHALAVIDRVRFGAVIDADRVAVAAMFHDASEIITGDLPTPVKYGNEALKNAYKQVESSAESQLVSLLPDDLADEYLPLIRYPDEFRPYIKAADKLSAMIKCIEEKNSGNRDFDVAYETLSAAVREMNFSPADVFMDEFLKGYSLTVDELRG